MPTCYSPVRRAPVSCIATEYCALDLHVLSTPPAFALSQDQTLVCILCLEMQNPESLRGQTSSGELFVVARFPQIAWLTLRQSKCEPNGFWHISFDQLSKSGPPVQQAGIQATDRFYQARHLSQGIKSTQNGRRKCAPLIDACRVRHASRERQSPDWPRRPRHGIQHARNYRGGCHPEPGRPVLANVGEGSAFAVPPSATAPVLLLILSGDFAPSKNSPRYNPLRGIYEIHRRQTQKGPTQDFSVTR